MQILAVVVRYKTPIAESQTLQGLAQALTADPALAAAYKVLVWDNSPEPLLEPQLPIPFEYRHSERNLGVSGAYNSAMEFAEAHGHVWMLLLDQDSTVTSHYLHAMLRHSRELEDRDEIAVILPTVRVAETIMSPKQQLFMRSGFYQRESEMLHGYAIGINSGAIMRVAWLRTIGGFSTISGSITRTCMSSISCFFTARVCGTHRMPNWSTR
jgi:GT2 family glycosyltransferase